MLLMGSCKSVDIKHQGVKMNAGNAYRPPAEVNGENLLARCTAKLEGVQKIRDEIAALDEQKAASKALWLYNDLQISLGDLLSEVQLLSQVHPDAKVRTDAEKCEQDGSKIATDLSLDTKLYEAISLTDRSLLDVDGLRMLEHTLRDFKRAGVDQDEESRKQIKALKEELVAIGQKFGQNIRDETYYIELDKAEDLAGLPQDYIDAHLKPSGKYVISTDYPDYIPFMTYAKNDAARRALRFKYLNRGKDNGPVLAEMIKKRYELAQRLKYNSYADYVVEDKMIKKSAAIRDFIAQITEISKVGADREYQELLLFKQKSVPDAKIIEGHESGYLEDAYKKEKFGFDSQKVRPYFPYNQVRDGLMKVTGDLFGIRYERVTDAKVWHVSVDTYDVFDETGKIGRIYLDMHPREGKFKHAAQFTVRSGILDYQYPEGALVCNFADPSVGDGKALMEHDQVVTFFHEFGHLLHHVFGGRQKWASFSGVATEWDFVEAPSQLLEEWAKSPEVLATFARHNETGEPIPEALVSQLIAADEFGKAIGARQQMFYAALSVNYFDLDPQSFDPLALMKELQSKYSYFPYEEGTHFIHSFGHLDDYSAIYYTYMWSLSIAKDLLTPFKENGLMDRATARRYRDLVLSPGGSKDAAALVEQFLGRPFQFEAFQKWLSEQPVVANSH
jgi:thimet oligopeptidase